MKRDHLEINIDSLGEKGINRYKAVMMAAKEARYLHEKMQMGLLPKEEKASTMAIQKLFEGKIVESREEGVGEE